jgi:hypothetical protein
MGDISLTTAIYTLVTALFTLIFALMAMPAERLRLFWQTFLSGITAYAMLNFVARLQGETLNIWGIQEYTTANLHQFCQGMIFKCIFWVVTSWVFFYVGLRLIIGTLFHERLKKILSKQFEDAKSNELFFNRIIKSLYSGLKIRQTFSPYKPQLRTEMTKEERNRRLDYDLRINFNNMSFIIHLLCCVLISPIPYKGIWVGAILLVFVLMIMVIPYTKAIIELLDYKESVNTI